MIELIGTLTAACVGYLVAQTLVNAYFYARGRK